MKQTFYNLKEEKRNRIIAACITEFGEYGFEGGSTDRIIARCGISKGGLYEYISSKEDLYLGMVEYAYNELYLYIQDRIKASGKPIPSDVLDRFRMVSVIAVDFYLSRPDIVRFINRANNTLNTALLEKINRIFHAHFDTVFGGMDFSGVEYQADKVIGLLKWLLIKTRNDFLSALTDRELARTARESYLDEWKFFIGVCKKGIYKSV